MRAHPFYPSMAVDLTPKEIEALQHIKNRANTSAALYARLESLDLIEKGLNGNWMLTDQGLYRLAIGKQTTLA